MVMGEKEKEKKRSGGGPTEKEAGWWNQAVPPMIRLFHQESIVGQH